VEVGGGEALSGGRGGVIWREGRRYLEGGEALLTSDDTDIIPI
jgi:hypothetical protein